MNGRRIIILMVEIRSITAEQSIQEAKIKKQELKIQTVQNGMKSRKKSV